MLSTICSSIFKLLNCDWERASRAVDRKRPSVCERTFDLWVIVTMPCLESLGSAVCLIFALRTAIWPAMSAIRHDALLDMRFIASAI